MMNPISSQPLHPAPGDQVAIGEDQLNSLLVDSVEEYAIYLLDPQGNILTWNTGAAQLNGYAKE
jgi:PAS domain-containing protein